MSEEKEAIQGFKAIIAILFLGLYAGWRSYDEVEYAFWAKTAEATIVELDVEHQIRRRRGLEQEGVVKIVYKDEFAGVAKKRDSFNVPVEELHDFKRGEAITVQYLKSRTFSARPLQDTDWTWPAVFVGTLIFGGFYIRYASKVSSERST